MKYTVREKRYANCDPIIAEALRMKYTVREKRYANCDPIIAEALRQGKDILCEVWDDHNDVPSEAWVVAYSANMRIPYLTRLVGFRHALPVVKKRILKDPIAMMETLIDDGYKVDMVGSWVLRGAATFYNTCWCLCGKELPDGYEKDFPDNWFEER